VILASEPRLLLVRNEKEKQPDLFRRAAQADFAVFRGRIERLPASVAWRCRCDPPHLVPKTCVGRHGENSFLFSGAADFHRALDKQLSQRTSASRAQQKPQSPSLAGWGFFSQARQWQRRVRRTRPCRTRSRRAGYIGLTVGWAGAGIGLDVRRPALKLPGLGRFGVAAGL